MLRICSICTLLWVISAGFADDATTPGEVKTLDGTLHKGAVTKITETEIRIGAGKDEEKLPAAEVLDIQLQAAKTPPVGPYLEIGLNDGSRFLCQAFGLKDKTAELRLFTGHAISVQIDAIRYVLCEAHLEDKRQEFEQFQAKRNGLDILRLLSRDGNSVNTFEGFIGDADDKGETIRFTPEGGQPAQVSLARVRALIFSRKAETLPKPVARVHDAMGNAFPVVKVATEANVYQLETPLGVKVELSKALAQRFDFSLGKMAYLSDLEPLKVDGDQAQLTTSSVWPPRLYTRDKHLEGGLLSLNRKTYTKGLSTHARCVLEYDVTGYNVFRGVLGIDDAMEGMGQALVRIDADGKELFTTPVTSKDKPRELELKIAGATKLRLTIDYGDDGDLGAHVDFAEARVMK